MKYLFFGTLLVSLLAVSFFPLTALAVNPVDHCTIQVEAVALYGTTYNIGQVVNEALTPNWGLVCALNTLHIVVNWVFLALIALVILIVLLGAYNLMTAAGDTTKVKKGRDLIMYAAIGLLVALLAKAFPSLLNIFLG